MMSDDMQGGCEDGGPGAAEILVSALVMAGVLIVGVVVIVAPLVSVLLRP